GRGAAVTVLLPSCLVGGPAPTSVLPLVPNPAAGAFIASAGGCKSTCTVIVLVGPFFPRTSCARRGIAPGVFRSTVKRKFPFRSDFVDFVYGPAAASASRTLARGAVVPTSVTRDLVTMPSLSGSELRS